MNQRKKIYDKYSVITLNQTLKRPHYAISPHIPPIIISGVFSMYFTGTTNSVASGISSTQWPTKYTNNYSTSLWFKWDGTGGGTITHNLYTLGTSDRIRIAKITKKLNIGVGGTYTTSANAIPNETSWHHLGLTHNASDRAYIVYLDGVQIMSGIGGTTDPGSTSVLFGTDMVSSHYPGYIYNPTSWNRVLSSGEMFILANVDFRYNTNLGSYSSGQIFDYYYNTIQDTIVSNKVDAHVYPLILATGVVISSTIPSPSGLPMISLSNALDGQVLIPDTAYDIDWSYSGVNTGATIYLYDNGVWTRTITSGIATNALTYNWTVPTNLTSGANYSINMIVNYFLLEDTTNVFTINAVSVRDAFAERWMYFPPDVTAYYYGGSGPTLNDNGTNVYGLRATTDARRASGVVNGKYFMDYVHNIDPYMNFMYVDHDMFAGSGNVIDNNYKGMSGMVALADHAASLGVKFGLNVSKTSKTTPFSLTDSVSARNYSTHTIYDADGFAEYNGWRFNTTQFYNASVDGQAAIGTASVNKGLYSLVHASGAAYVTYATTGQTADTRVYLGWNTDQSTTPLPEKRYLLFQYDLLYSGVQRIDATMSTTYAWYESLFGDLPELAPSRSHMYEYIIYSGGTTVYRPSASGTTGFWNATVNNTNDSGIVGIRVYKPFATDLYPNALIGIYLTTNGTWEVGETPSGYIIITNILATDSSPTWPPSTGSISHEMFTPDVTLTGMYHLGTVGVGRWGWNYKHEGPRDFVSGYIDAIMATNIGQHSNLHLLYGEEDEMRAGTGWDYDAPSGIDVGKYYAEFMARISTQTSYKYGKQHMMFGDMFNPYHNAIKFLYGSNPTNFTTAASGGYAGTLNYYLNSSDLTLGNNDPTMFADWTHSTLAVASGSVYFWDNSGRPWVMSIPLLDTAAYFNSSGVAIGETTAWNTAMPYKRQLIYDRLVSGLSTCSGVHYHGWETPSWVFTPGVPGLEAYSGLLPGGPSVWQPWVEWFRDAKISGIV